MSLYLSHVVISMLPFDVFRDNYLGLNVTELSHSVKCRKLTAIIKTITLIDEPKIHPTGW